MLDKISISLLYLICAVCFLLAGLWSLGRGTTMGKLYFAAAVFFAVLAFKNRRSGKKSKS